MKITVVGAGYVGLVTAACLAELGNQVSVVDQDFGRISLLQAGGVPIYEPGLDTLMQRNGEAGRLRFSASLPHAMRETQVIFIAVGTPQLDDGSPDLSSVLCVAQEVGTHLREFKVVVIKSTVPVGTTALVEQAIRTAMATQGRAPVSFAVVSNPEFLKEGAAIDDFMRPDRIVIGVSETDAGDRARSVLTRLYAPFNRHHERTLWMDVPSAELTKYAANAMLATRISFMNEMANLADQFNADIDSVRRGIGADERIGHGFLYAGAGYGGSCFPKDTRALAHTASLHGQRMHIVEATEQVNNAQKFALVRHVTDAFGKDLEGLRIAVWGLAFKPNTDDMREAPSRTVITELLAHGAEIVAYDPVAKAAAERALEADLSASPGKMARVRFADSPLDAIDGADALLILTEWKCFQNPDFSEMARRMRRTVVFDGRNLYDPDQLQELGIPYRGIGRRNRLADALDGVRIAGAPIPGQVAGALNANAVDYAA